MSTRSSTPPLGAGAVTRRRLTVDEVKRSRGRPQPLVMVTAFDFVSAQAGERAGVDLILVGDSAAMTMLGYESTQLVSVDEMLMLTRASRRGAPNTLLIGDLPFGSYEESDALAVATARKFADAGCDAIKMEGAGPTIERARAVVRAGVPVMGHVGLTPQRTGAGESYRVQGRTAEEGLAILKGARGLQEAGCFSIVAEAIPAPLTRLLVLRLDVPVIGIGAGSAPDGQVLVFHDLVGMYDAHVPKFVRRYAELKPALIDALARFAAEVRSRAFPGPENEYGMEGAEVRRLEGMI